MQRYARWQHGRRGYSIGRFDGIGSSTGMIFLVTATTCGKQLSTRTRRPRPRSPECHQSSAGTNGEVVAENHGIARDLLQAFFPVLPLCKQEEAQAVYNQLLWEPIAKHEFKAVMFRASQDKAPGRDGFTARVWRELWPVVGDEIMLLLQIIRVRENTA